MVESNEDRRQVDSALRQQLTVAWTKALPIVSAFVGSSVRDFHKAEDVVQEVAATVAAKFDEYDSERPFVNWALGIARNKVLGLHRKEAASRLLFDEETINRIVAAAGEIAGELESREIALKHCLKQLSRRARTLLEARYRLDEPVAVIAQNVGLSVNSVYVTLHRIRETLRECIDRKLMARP